MLRRNITTVRSPLSSLGYFGHFAVESLVVFLETGVTDCDEIRNMVLIWLDWHCCESTLTLGISDHTAQLARVVVALEGGFTCLSVVVSLRHLPSVSRTSC
jgi:hypothetical protein